MELENLNQVLEDAWKYPMISDDDETKNEQPKRKKKLLKLGERKVKAENPVIFENGKFFVERASEYLVIRPKTMTEYLKKFFREDGTTYKILKFERRVKDIIIPLSHTAENPMKWFEEKYVLNSKRNTQGRFIRQIWKYKKDVFGEVMLG